MQLNLAQLERYLCQYDGAPIKIEDLWKRPRTTPRKVVLEVCQGNREALESLQESVRSLLQCPVNRQTYLKLRLVSNQIHRELTSDALLEEVKEDFNSLTLYQVTSSLVRGVKSYLCWTQSQRDEQTRSFLARLPIEVLPHLWKQLDVESQNALTLVCKRLRALSPQLMEKCWITLQQRLGRLLAHESDWPLENFLAKLPRQVYEKPISLQIGHVVRQVLHHSYLEGIAARIGKLQQKFPHIHSLGFVTSWLEWPRQTYYQQSLLTTAFWLGAPVDQRLHGPLHTQKFRFECIDRVELNLVLATCQNLQSIRIDGIGEWGQSYKTPLLWPTTLREVELYARIMPVELKNLFTLSGALLERLTLHHDRPIELPKQYPPPTKLQVLDITELCSGLADFVRQLPALKVLRIKCTFSSLAELSTLTLNTLEELSVVSSRFLPDVASFCPNLRTYSFTFYEGDLDFSKLPKGLEELTIMYSPLENAYRTYLQQISINLPNLQTLRLINWSELSVSHFSGVKFEHLRTLEVQKSKLTKVDLPALKIACPRLESTNVGTDDPLLNLIGNLHNLFHSDP